MNNPKGSYTAHFAEWLHFTGVGLLTVGVVRIFARLSSAAPSSSSTVPGVAHRPGNDICESSPFESCICHLTEREQLARLDNAARACTARLHATGFTDAWDDELEELDEITESGTR